MQEAAPQDAELAYQLEQQSFDDSVAYRKALRTLGAPVELAKCHYQGAGSDDGAQKTPRRLIDYNSHSTNSTS